MSQKMWSFPECYQLAELHIVPVLRSFPDCWRQTFWVFFFFSSCTKIFKTLQCGHTDLYNALIMFLKKKSCVHVYTCMLAFFQKEVFNSFSLLLASPTPSLEWGRWRLNRIWSFPAEKETFSATQSVFKGLIF